MIFAGLNHLIPKAKFVPGMTLLTSATLVMELLRYRKGFGWMNEILHFCLGSSLRKHEMDGKFTGSFYYFLGVTLTSALYSKPAATLAIIQLAIADPTASYFGRQTRHVYWSRIEKCVKLCVGKCLYGNELKSHPYVVFCCIML
jgi:dolichol kinase